ncbi:primosomal protein N' (replication factor Y) - superfamily II helicase [Plastorhodobacter daqingensis]|uniref:Primosomal protein N' (Replication factor Y) -superfamily II helicase n=1 Tax=Plastorhodobacter daqingensis TaxID=1387281 RepID=A0ABW2UK60_9RHOB
MSADDPAKAAFRYPCDRCGALLRFAPGQDHLRCTHCGHEQDIPPAAAEKRAKALEELDLHQALGQLLPANAIEETRVVTCHACGAQITFDADSHAGTCPFCATPVVVDTGAHRHIKPQALIPFRITEAEAHEAMTGWLGRLWFAPSGLRDYARRGRRLDGLYVPYWTFDAESETDYSGLRGIYYYETRTVMVTVNGKRQPRQQQVRKVRWTPVQGRVRRFFDDLLVMGATSLPRRHADGLAPWDLGGLQPYSPDYLAGFRAEGYTVELAQAFALAREQMDRIIAQDIRRDIGGNEQQIHHAETRLSGETFKHILLPVWMAAYRYRGRSYRFVVNGQSGKIQGERPWSAWKIALAVLGLVLIAAVAAYLSR